MKDFLRSVLVLALICLVISSALALTNNKTAPIIESAAAEKAEKARREVLPEAESFTELTLSGLPSSIMAAYIADNGAGFVFMMSAKGYGGDISLICGISGDGKITSCTTLSHSETKGLGSKITLPEFENQFEGKDSSLSGVDTISGATISTQAYINAIKDVFEAFELAKEAE